MTEFILSYEKYLTRECDVLNEEEGWKKWITIFMMLLNMGIVPPKIKAADLQTKIEWVQNIPQEDIALAKFTSMLTQQNIGDDDSEEIQKLLKNFNAQNKTKITLDDIIKNTEVESHKPKNSSRKYKWTLKLQQDSKFAVKNIEQIQPARYENGIALISDYGDFMRPTFEDSLNQVLFKYEKLTGVEIAIVTLPSLQDQDPSDFTIKTFNRWGIGKKGSNNGILIMTSMGDRKWWITTGYGMEEMFPDALCSRFGENYLVPNFREGNYEKGFQELIEAMKNEFGSIPIQMKKDLEKKYEKIHDENVKDFFIGFGEFLLVALVLGLLTYLIMSAYKKRKELSRKITRTKDDMAALGLNIEDLIKNGDPIFNDDEVLDGLKKSVIELHKRKMGNEKKLTEVSTLLNTYIAEIENIKKIEFGINKVKKSVTDIFNKLKTYDNEQTQMKDVANTCLGIMNDLKFENIEVSVDSLLKYQKLLGRVTDYYNKYQNMDQEFQKIKSNVEGFDSVKKALLMKLSKAKEYTQKVIEMGYDTKIETKEQDIESLKNFVDQIGSIYMTDLAKGMELLNKYAGKAHMIGSELEKPVSKFNDIMSAKKFVDAGPTEINKKLKHIEDYIHSGFLDRDSTQKAQDIIAKYNKDKGTSGHSKEDPYGEEAWDDNIPMKDVMRVSTLLTATLAALDKIVDIGRNNAEEERARIRRKKEEEERKKREEEEEERRRRRRRSSSSYSGGSYGGDSSFEGGGGGFSFGGGSSGGGGAGGSW